MKRLLILSLIISFLVSFTATKEETTLRNLAFNTGEKLTFRLHYGFLNAGEATFEVNKSIFKIKDKACYKVDVRGRSRGAVEAMYPVRDLWRSYIDTASMQPVKFFRDIKEGGYRLIETTFYKPEQKKLAVHWKKTNNGKKTIENYNVPSSVHDIVSSYYYLRNINYNTLKKGDVVGVNAFVEDELFNFKVKYVGKTKVKTKLGKVRAIKLQPLMPNNDLFEGDDSIEIWLSDDGNKIPLKIKAKMFVGAVEVDIKSANGLKHKLNKV